MYRVPIMLRLPEKLHERLKQEAKEKGVSLNDLICFRLSEPLDKTLGQTQSPC